MMTALNPNTQALADAGTRARALDPQQSFIVQAPAGSGKTELLTNRLLVLLARVQQPEQIIAITFTRKAAAEMRARVLEKLEDSAAILAGSKALPVNAHELLTHELACAVLQRDAELDWQLRALSSRLRIQTIDSLCAALTRQMPYLSRLGGQAGIVDNATALYELAARSTLAMLEDASPDNAEYQAALAELLRHCDNNGEQAMRLLVQMLARRDQWLPLLNAEQTPATAVAFRAQLSAVVQAELRALSAHIPTDIQMHLMPLAQHAAAQLQATNANTNRPVQALHDWAELLDEYSELALWRGLRALLLTGEGELRKAGGINKNLGFGTEHKAEKAAFVALINSLQGADWPPLLAHVDNLPRPEAAELQWPFIAAMLQVLRLCAAHLHALFAERGELDFIAINQAALQALGSEEAPTDLLLALDHQIQHLLVDEFQDTSISQWTLLRRLTAGWHKGDGRTLFVVGDPMQSIYRFRKAEVSLFLRAQEHGLHADLPLQRLTLQSNFRSQAGIVDWVNSTFTRVLPAQADASYGAVPYSTAIAVKPAGAAPAVHCQLVVRADSSTDVTAKEADLVLEAVQAALEKNHETIAILVRARTALPKIIAQLQNANIAFEAVDIQTLAHSPLISDLVQLARALWHPADRLAWLCVLRAPWCGLTAADLFALCGEQTSLTVMEQLQRAFANENSIALSADGRLRMNRIWPVLREFFLQQDSQPLAARVEACWRALGGVAVLQNADERRDVEQFFQKLNSLRLDDGDVPGLLDAMTADLYQQSASGARVKLMTMHKAKGLEFDTVIVPGLGRRPNNDTTPLLAWDEYVYDDGELLLLAPAEHKADVKSEQGSGLAAFLREREQRRSDEEAKRLLYVAATRAKKTLHLIGHATHVDAKGDSEEATVQIAARSHLSMLWPTLSQDFMSNIEFVRAGNSESNMIEVPLQRLTSDWFQRAMQSDMERGVVAAMPTSDVVNIGALSSAASVAEPNLEHQDLRAIGTVTHAWLEQFSTMELPVGSDAISIFIDSLQARVFSQLRWLGLSRPQAQNAQSIVLRALSNTLNDSQGRFLLEQRQHAHAEWPLRSQQGDSLALNIIDRSFVDDDDVRWIVDYKIVHEIENLSTTELAMFAHKQVQEYREQLSHYAELVRAIDPRAQKLALYFPLHKQFQVLAQDDLTMPALT